MNAALLSAILLALVSGDAVLSRVEARERAAPAERPTEHRRDCVAIGHASVDSITTEGLPLGRDPVGAGYLHVATLRNRLSRPLEVTVTFGAARASDAVRGSVHVLAPRGLLRLRLGVTPSRQPDGDLRAAISVLCAG